MYKYIFGALGYFSQVATHSLEAIAVDLTAF